MELNEQDQTEVAAQVERILQSEVFRSSNVLRRLLAFLLAKFLSGEADQLKEYWVAVEGLGRPESFDPTQESIVRIHMGRLRLKLDNYYRTEGQHDPLLIQFPKRRFTLTCERRTVAIVEETPLESMPIEEPPLFEAAAQPEPLVDLQRTCRVVCAHRSLGSDRSGVVARSACCGGRPGPLESRDGTGLGADGHFSACAHRFAF